MYKKIKILTFTIATTIFLLKTCLATTGEASYGVNTLGVGMTTIVCVKDAFVDVLIINKNRFNAKVPIYLTYHTKQNNKILCSHLYKRIHCLQIQVSCRSI